MYSIIGHVERIARQGKISRRCRRLYCLALLNYLQFECTDVLKLHTCVTYKYKLYLSYIYHVQSRGARPIGNAY